ncbi:Lipopolysaccharide heptosyltransferase 1 [Candidatus Rhabdochlamydia oedothoracis]|uniref:Lipopolysaccharide heptosyltransferase 1 n=1 Tax=Candidatus Rhabdochlamydia oedothoracis TaxID=2720720 RepID=A0ABX8V703_9BACT|nr:MULTISPECIES: glycosyltransferase family 9 protein [Rhabdochlamydia]KAG6559770.1 Lipopolysaccharide heptosyltransferase 1 [Candidatus Rhabdochlamydia sp. W815]MCL6755879.1 glycosyltransferase family 9 protein [Candidatus Rhabdochlamydia oedothoracis]QYF48999.1 Lipopolysaccharide heptosyltransferase 1 [Candidatus Rhabdochlamydia oedothoracis]
MQSSSFSILLVKTSSIGDVIQTLPTLQYLRARFPEAMIDWVVEESNASLLSASSLLSNIIVINTKAWRSSLGAWKTFFSTLKNLRSKKYDLLFDLQGNAKSACVTFLARAKEKIGFDSTHVQEKINLLVTTRKIPLAKTLNAQMKYLQLIQHYFNDDAIFLPQSISMNLTFLEKNRLEILLANRSLKVPIRLMIAAHSHWPNKEIQVETLCTLLTHISTQYSVCFLFVYHTGSEKQQADYMVQRFKSQSLSIGELSLPLWQSLMSEMDGVICVDSAALHLCATTNTPSFSMFGPSLAERYRPIGLQHFSIQGSCPYQVQFWSRCPLLRKCATGACLKNLDTHHLIKVCSEWLVTIKNRLQ